jgi:hypothetical protein
MSDYTYQVAQVDNYTRIHILVFDEDEFVRKIVVEPSEFRPNPYVWVLGYGFRTLFKGKAIAAYKWLETHPDRVLAKQVGIGKDFQMHSVGEFKELYG